MLKAWIKHSIAWVVFTAYILASSYGYYIEKYDGDFVIFKQFTSISIIVIIFYLNYAFLTPKYLIQKKKYLLFSLGIVGILCVESILTVCNAYVLDLYLGYQKFFPVSLSKLLTGLFSPILYIAVSTGLRLGKEYYDEKKIKSELEHKIAQAELGMLRSQINPHFLFNTLNNIYALAQNKSEKTPEAILRLSNIMRYMLHDSTKEKVKLEKEVVFLNDFIELQRLRVTDKNMVNLIPSFKGSQMISPLLLIPIVENAFKHSNLSDTSQPITIDFSVSNNQTLNLTVTNQISDGEKPDTSGIGLENLKKRLSILYPEKHKLEITLKGDLFKAALQLEVD